MLNSTIEQLKSVKEDNARWCSEVEEVLSFSKDDYGIAIGTSVGITRNAPNFRDSFVIPYIIGLVRKIENRFAEGVQLQKVYNCRCTIANGSIHFEPC